MSVFADEIQRLEAEVSDRDDEISRLKKELALTEVQIHEPGGFIERVVELEEENANLRVTVEEDLCYQRQLEDLLQAYAEATTRVEVLAYAYIREARVLEHPLTADLVQQIGRDFLKALLKPEVK